MKTQKLLEFIRGCGAHGATDKEAADHFGADRSRVNVVRQLLVAGGQVKAAPEKRGLHKVWIAVER
jgi:hypothetical protein